MSKLTPKNLTPAEPEPQPCAFMTCQSGHTWPLTLQVAGCQGCQGPTIAFQAQLCPVCNEPFSQARIRVDITTDLIGIPQICKNQAGRALTAYIYLNYSDWDDFRLLEYSKPIIHNLLDSKNKLVDNIVEAKQLNDAKKEETACTVNLQKNTNAKSPN